MCAVWGHVIGLTDTVAEYFSRFYAMSTLIAKFSFRENPSVEFINKWMRVLVGGVLLDIMLCYHRTWWRRRNFELGRKESRRRSAEMFTLSTTRERRKAWRKFVWMYLYNKVVVTLYHIFYTAITSKASRLYMKLSPHPTLGFSFHSHNHSREFSRHNERVKESERVECEAGKEDDDFFTQKKNFTVMLKRPNSVLFRTLRQQDWFEIDSWGEVCTIRGERGKNVPFIVFRARKSECKGISCKSSLLDVYSIIDVHASSIERNILKRKKNKK